MLEVGEWEEIDDERVRHIWECNDSDCDAHEKTVTVGPDWYTENGTPVCECGRDMVYVRTEILQ